MVPYGLKVGTVATATTSPGGLFQRADAAIDFALGLGIDDVGEIVDRLRQLRWSGLSREQGRRYRQDRRRAGGLSPRVNVLPQSFHRGQ